MIEQEQRAFLLHSRPYKDNQKLVELLTERDGKLAALVYINKSSKSNRNGVLQPFTPLNIVLKGNSSLKHISRVEAINKSYLLTGETLFSAMYLNELLVRLLGEHNICEELFHSYKLSLAGLAQGSAIELTLRKFELTLLDELGVSLDFTPVFDNLTPTFYYQSEQGFLPVEEKQALPCYRREHLQAIALQDFSSKDVLICFKRLMRQVLNHLLGTKPLHSRKLFTKKYPSKGK